MLPQRYRLPATQKLPKSKFYKSQFFSCKFCQNQEEVSRFGFLVRKTVDKRAVVRNRIRRVFRSCVEKRLSQIAPGYDMLFFLEKGIMDERHEEVMQKLVKFLHDEHLET